MKYTDVDFDSGPAKNMGRIKMIDELNEHASSLITNIENLDNSVRDLGYRLIGWDFTVKKNQQFELEKTSTEVPSNGSLGILKNQLLVLITQIDSLKESIKELEKL